MMQFQRQTCMLVLLLAFSAYTRGEELKIVEPPKQLQDELKLDTFYKKCILVDKFAIVASEKVSDYALYEAAYIVNKMLDGRNDIRKALVEKKIRLAIMAATEFTTHIPEHKDLRPPEYWNKRARGLGATTVRPAVSCAEENLLEFPGDPYRGENILTHEFSHAIHEIGMRQVDKDFDGKLKIAYEAAMSEGLWNNTYAATNRAEYWAEGAQCWFHSNRTNTSDHNNVGTREELKKYDPRLAKLMEEVFRDNAWTYTSLDKRKSADHLTGYDKSKSPKFVWPKEVIEGWERYQREKKK